MGLTANGARIFSTFLGGRVSDDISQGIAVDGQGIYLTGYTRNVGIGTEDPADYFPTTASSAGTGGDDLFVTKLASDGSHINYSIVLGGMDPDLGPGTTDRGYAVAARAGNAYVTGYTDSVDFPTTAGALDTTHNGSNDALALKVSSAGTLTYSTFLGGTGDDRGNAISVDASGAAYVGGETSSTAFPTTAGAFDTTYNGGPRDAFVTKVAPNGSALAYSTFLGGTDDDVCKGIALDASGAAFVTGNVSSTTYPTTPGAFDTTHNGGTSDAFVTKLDATGAGLVYSTFLGGSAIDNGNAIAVDAAGVAYVTGVTFSTTFPTTPGGFDTTYNGNSDAFVTRLSPAGNLLLDSTFLGGSGADRGNGIAVDTTGAAYVTGQTSSLDFVISGFGINDGASAFIVKLSGAGADTAGIYVASTGAWFLKNTNAGGSADLVFSFGPAAAGLVALRGDWDGNGADSPGLYDPATGNFFLKNSNAPGAADLVFSFGAGGPDVVAVTGDYDGDGVDTVGIYIRSTGAFFLKNSNAAGPADLVFSFGPGGADIEPLFGDYDGNGTDTVGIYNRTSGAWFLKNTNSGGAADLVFGFGPAGAGVEPLVGDYDGDGDDTVGVYISSTGAWFLKNTNGGGSADVVFSFGPANVKPLVGDWDGL
jgi:hypothetical protein